jgi:hypothetical protein
MYPTGPHPRESEALSRTVTCDDCKQGPGIPCITMAGCPRSRRSHFSRYQLARGLGVVERVPDDFKQEYEAKIERDN